MKEPVPDDQSRFAQGGLIENILILAATAVIAAAVLQAAPLQSANDRSRWATVWSLVERRTFQIDEIDAVGAWSTIDKVRYRTSESEPWHFYSSKPPLLSTMVAGLYAIERAILGYGLVHHTALVTRLLLLIVNVIPFYLSLRSLRTCLQLLGSGPYTRMFVIAVAGFGSILNPYLTTLNNHTPAVACAMFAITAAARILVSRSGAHSSDNDGKPSEPRSRDFASLGFFAALTCCFELPAAQMGVLAFLLAVVICSRKTAIWFVPAAAVPLLAFFDTNWMATGGVKPFYATYGTETYVYEHNGVPSYWTNPRDLDANTESTPVYLFHCILGHHGLLSLTPVLLVAVCGTLLALLLALGRKAESRNLLILSGALMTLVTLGFYLTRTENYNYGGNSVGLRWMMWLSPFWWIAMVPALERIQRRGIHFACGLLLAASIVSVNWSINRPWRPSWLFEQMEAAGWINYRTPIKPFDPARFSVLGELPSVPKTSMSWTSSRGTRLQLEMLTSNGDTLQLQVQLTPTGEATQTFVFAASRSRFLKGQRWLSVPADQSQGQASAQTLVEIERLLQGLPAIRAFNAAGPTWIPSRKDSTKAWKVERAAIRVVIDDPALGKIWHRCDVQYCDQLPFGVLQWKTSVTAEATNELLDTETWTADQP
jgi:hypothetical protein